MDTESFLTLPVSLEPPRYEIDKKYILTVFLRERTCDYLVKINHIDYLGFIYFDIIKCITNTTDFDKCCLINNFMADKKDFIKKCKPKPGDKTPNDNLQNLNKIAVQINEDFDEYYPLGRNIFNSVIEKVKNFDRQKFLEDNDGDIEKLKKHITEIKKEIINDMFKLHRKKGYSYSQIYEKKKGMILFEYPYTPLNI